jgi:hypothetical protein
MQMQAQYAGMMKKRVLFKNMASKTGTSPQIVLAAAVLAQAWQQFHYLD